MGTVSGSKVYSASNIKSEQNNISILKNVFFPFRSVFASSFDLGLTPSCDQIIVMKHFGTNKAFFKIAVDFAGSLGGFGSLSNCPGPNFLRAGSKISDQSEYMITRTNQSIEPWFFYPEGF